MPKTRHGYAKKMYKRAYALLSIVCRMNWDAVSMILSRVLRGVAVVLLLLEFLQLGKI